VLDHEPSRAAAHHALGVVEHDGWWAGRGARGAASSAGRHGRGARREDGESRQTERVRGGHHGRAVRHGRKCPSRRCCCSCSRSRRCSRSRLSQESPLLLLSGVLTQDPPATEHVGGSWLPQRPPQPRASVLGRSDRLVERLRSFANSVASPARARAAAVPLDDRRRLRTHALAARRCVRSPAASARVDHLGPPQKGNAERDAAGGTAPAWPSVGGAAPRAPLAACGASAVASPQLQLQLHRHSCSCCC